MRLILFVLLAFLTITLLRRFRAPQRRPSSGKDGKRNAERPAASPDEIVDVSYEDCESSSTRDAERKP